MEINKVLINMVHQYQQDLQSPITITHWTQNRRPQHMMLEIKVLVWDRHKNVAGLKWLV